jgi:hypothetical protein
MHQTDIHLFSICINLPGSNNNFCALLRLFMLLNQQRRSFAIFLFLILSLSGPVFPVNQRAIRWGFSFPPVKDAGEMSYTLAHFKSLGIRHFRISENWAIREPKKGSINWAPLDARIHWALGNNLELLLTLQTEAPSWCRSLKGGNGFTTDDVAFSNFIASFLVRYANQIPLVQFGNEWDSAGFSGSAEDYLKWHRIVVQEVGRLSPKTKIVLGGVTQAWPAVRHALRDGKTLSLPRGTALAPGWTSERIEFSVKKALGKLDQSGIEMRIKKVFAEATYDLIDLHLYDAPETWAESVRIIQELSDKPLIVSEFGGPHPQWEIYDEARHRDFLKGAMEILQILPIQTAYHFTLVDHSDAWHRNNGLINTALREKRAYQVFKKFAGLP